MVTLALETWLAVKRAAGCAIDLEANRNVSSRAWPQKPNTSTTEHAGHHAGALQVNPLDPKELFSHVEDSTELHVPQMHRSRRQGSARPSDQPISGNEP